ncbi:hypothetical protein BgiMline_007810, partial [Biomphalaria glabrata]
MTARLTSPFPRSTPSLNATMTSFAYKFRLNSFCFALCNEDIHLQACVPYLGQRSRHWGAPGAVK